MANDPGSSHPNAADRSSGEASGKHQGVYRPDDNREASDALENVSLKDRGALMEDHLRDKRGNGVANDYDDSIEPTGDRKGITRGD
jgi:hypothetical protein